MKATFAQFFKILLLTFVLFELFFALRILTMRWLNPSSTTWQRTEIYRLMNRDAPIAWHQTWAPYVDISPFVKAAIVTSEDDSFMNHSAVDWSAIQFAWQHNARSISRYEKQLSHAEQSAHPEWMLRHVKPARIMGGSTLAQQLAKNLFLNGEKILPRKVQEMIFAYELEWLLGKRRIFELYLNSVEWGSGIFGVESASRYYFHKNAHALTPKEAAQLAVMLPQPLYLQGRINGSYVTKRSQEIVRSMGDAKYPK